MVAVARRAMPCTRRTSIEDESDTFKRLHRVDLLRDATAKPLELAHVLVRFEQVACRIVNADHGMV